MKFKVTMKDPDILYEAAREAVEEGLADIAGLTDQERATLLDRRVEEARVIADKWFEFGESVTIEIDTEAKTCVVVPVGE